jgi:hypothetical protein
VGWRDLLPFRSPPEGATLALTLTNGCAMRLVYRRDREGRLVETIDGGVAGTAVPREVLEDDEEYERIAVGVVFGRTQTEYEEECGAVGVLVGGPQSEEEVWVDGLGDAEPRPTALVVDEDPDMRIMMRRILEAEGYAVATCPGPRGTHCKAARYGAEAGTPCDRVPENTRLFILDNIAKQTHLREAYEAWFPDAEVLDSP